MVFAQPLTAAELSLESIYPGAGNSKQKIPESSRPFRRYIGYFHF